MDSSDKAPAPATSLRFADPSEPADVVVLIVSYRSGADLPGLFDSLRSEARTAALRVVVIDNASDDDSADVARAEGDVVVVESRGNLGYAAGLNLGMAQVGDADEILVLNPDLVVENGMLATLRQRQRQTGAGIVVPKVLDPDGGLFKSLRREPSLLRVLGDTVLGHHLPGRPDWLSESIRSELVYTAAAPIDWATGAAMLVDRRAWDQVGSWDESFFLYSEETDFCHRVRAAGYSIWYEPHAVVRHRQGGSGASQELVALLMVNKLRYMAKHHRHWSGPYRGALIVHEELRRDDRTHDLARTMLRSSSRWSELPGPTTTGSLTPTLGGADITGREDAGRYLVVKAKGGFGNRILSAVSGVLLAEATGRTPVIDWRDPEYLARDVNAYPLLFDDPVGIDVSVFDERTDVHPPIWAGRMAEHPIDIISQDFPNDHSNPFIYRKLSVDLARPRATPTDVAVFWSYLPKGARIRRHLRALPAYGGAGPAAITRQALGHYFRPNERVRAQVEELFAGRDRPLIGVHVRYTDRKVSLDRVLAELGRLRVTLPGAGIFLATDNQRVQNDFLARFPEVFVIDKALGDDQNSLHEHVVHADPLREAENALVDMWALASCDWLVHSRHSTFSVAAAAIGGIPRSRQRDIDRHNPRIVLKRWFQTWA